MLFDFKVRLTQHTHTTSTLRTYAPKPHTHSPLNKWKPCVYLHHRTRYICRKLSMRLANTVIKDTIFTSNHNRMVDYNAAYKKMMIPTHSAPDVLLGVAIHEKFGLQPPVQKLRLVHRRDESGATHVSRFGWEGSPEIHDSLASQRRAGAAAPIGVAPQAAVEFMCEEVCRATAMSNTHGAALMAIEGHFALTSSGGEGGTPASLSLQTDSFWPWYQGMQFNRQLSTSSTTPAADHEPQAIACGPFCYCQHCYRSTAGYCCHECWPPVLQLRRARAGLRAAALPITIQGGPRRRAGRSSSQFSF
jgi:hypothetical protein